MKNDQFYVPFLHSLLIIASITLVSMSLSKILVETYLFPTFNTTSSSVETFTSSRNIDR